MKISIGTRGSQLALTQAEQVRAQIARLLPKDEVVLEVVKTTGDQMGESGKNQPPDPPQGIFTKELDEALLGERIRGAIHSLKDVPTLLLRGIRYGAFVKREDPRDALVSKNGKKFKELSQGAKVGTSSPRREAQLKTTRPDLQVTPLRGNVDTRLRKLSTGEVDAIVVAAAGLRRLGREKEITELLSPEVMLPAPAQGILCVTIREADQEFLELLKPLNDPNSLVCAQAERSFLKTLQGGCRVPVGALATIDGKVLSLMGVIAHPNGSQTLRNQQIGDIDHPVELGEELAKRFLENGAGEILKQFGRSTW